VNEIFYPALAVLALAMVPVSAGDRPFDWDRYHARQDACREADQIAQDCTRGFALVRRASAPSGPARVLGLRALGERP
jgi:hypothetical protein